MEICVGFFIRNIKYTLKNKQKYNIIKKRVKKISIFTLQKIHLK